MKGKTSLEQMREDNHLIAQRKFDNIVIEREDAELRKKFCMSGELHLHPTDQQCKDNPEMVVYAQDGMHFPRALMYPPAKKTVDYSKINFGKKVEYKTLPEWDKVLREEAEAERRTNDAFKIIETLIKNGNMTLMQGHNIALAL